VGRRRPALAARRRRFPSRPAARRARVRVLTLMPSTPDSRRHVLGDWGTTRLRLFLIEDDRVASQCEGPGIAALVAAPPQILTQLVTPWRRSDDRLAVYLAGMVGSRNGW